MSPGGYSDVAAFKTGSSTQAALCVIIVVFKQQIQLSYSVTVSHDTFWCFLSVSHIINLRRGLMATGKFQHWWLESFAPCVETLMKMLLWRLHLHHNVKGSGSWLGTSMFFSGELVLVVFFNHAELTDIQYHIRLARTSFTMQAFCAIFHWADTLIIENKSVYCFMLEN